MMGLATHQHSTRLTRRTNIDSDYGTHDTATSTLSSSSHVDKHTLAHTHAAVMGRIAYHTHQATSRPSLHDQHSGVLVDAPRWHTTIPLGVCHPLSTPTRKQQTDPLHKPNNKKTPGDFDTKKSSSSTPSPPLLSCCWSGTANPSD